MVDGATLSIMLLPLDDPIAQQVQSRSWDLSGWSIHKSCADVHCRNCRYCRLVSRPPLACSRIETVVLTSPASVHEYCDWRQMFETWLQKSLSEPPRFQGAYVPMNRCTNPWPWEVLNTRSIAITLPRRAGWERDTCCTICKSFWIPTITPHLYRWWLSVFTPVSSKIL